MPFKFYLTSRLKGGSAKVPRLNAGPIPVCTIPVVTLETSQSNTIARKEKKTMRVPKVTRTMKNTVVTMMAVNTQSKDVFEQEIVLPRTYKDETKIMKLIQAMFAGEPVQPVSILSTRVEESLYGMTEADFLKYAEKLPPRTNAK